MKQNITKNILSSKSFIKIVILLCFILSPYLTHAQSLPNLRVFYRPDGGVSITVFAANACQEQETVTQCMDRISSNNAEYGLPYDDMTADQLPPDRSQRDKWRGEKGRGVWVDESLVSRSDKRNEYQSQLDQELDRDEPNPSKVLKLERIIEKINDIDHSILSPEDIASIEVKNESMLQSIARGAGRLFSGIGQGIRNGILALTSIVTETLRVGSPEAPAGITIYDTKTGQPYCMVVEDGVMKNLPGECGSQSTVTTVTENTDTATTTEQSTTATTTAETTGEIIITSVDTTSPIITINGNNPAEITFNSSYLDLGASVADTDENGQVNNNLGLRFSVDGVTMNDISIDTSWNSTTTPQATTTHTIIYSAVDGAGNWGYATRTVDVIPQFP